MTTSTLNAPETWDATEKPIGQETSAELETAERVAPETPTELQLAGILKNVLEIQEDVGIHQRFTKIGGNSLNLITVIKKIKEEMGVTLKSRVFFDPKISTIFKLSQEIDALRACNETNS